MNASNIPIGVGYDRHAPWRQMENHAVKRDCEVTETIARKVILSTTDYTAEEDSDEELGMCMYSDTSETDWEKEYVKQEYTVLELIARLKEYVLEDIKNAASNTGRGRELQRLLAACDGWEQVEIEVEEE